MWTEAAVKWVILLPLLPGWDTTKLIAELDNVQHSHQFSITNKNNNTKFIDRIYRWRVSLASDHQIPNDPRASYICVASMNGPDICFGFLLNAPLPVDTYRRCESGKFRFGRMFTRREKKTKCCLPNVSGKFAMRTRSSSNVFGRSYSEVKLESNDFFFVRMLATQRSSQWDWAWIYSDVCTVNVYALCCLASKHFDKVGINVSNCVCVESKQRAPNTKYIHKLLPLCAKRPNRT